MFFFSENVILDTGISTKLIPNKKVNKLLKIEHFKNIDKLSKIPCQKRQRVFLTLSFKSFKRFFLLFGAQKLNKFTV